MASIAVLSFSRRWSGDAEQVADDGHRQWQRQVLPHVSRRPGRQGGEGVDQTIRGRLDQRTHLFDPPRRERGGDTAPEPAVLLAVGVKEALQQDDGGQRPALGNVGQAGPVPVGVARDARVAGQCLNDAVPGDRPRLEGPRKLDEYRRPLGAQRSGLRVHRAGRGIEDGTPGNGQERQAISPSLSGKLHGGLPPIPHGECPATADPACPSSYTCCPCNSNSRA